MRDMQFARDLSLLDLDHISIVDAAQTLRIVLSDQGKLLENHVTNHMHVTCVR